MQVPIPMPTEPPRSRFLASVAATLVATLLFGVVPALGETFDVDARIFCPASLETDSSGAVVGVDAGYDAGSVRWVPCAGILVMAMDSDDDWDDVCAAGFTDSQGFVRFRGAQCSDPTNRPEVYLKIVAESPMGFSVGTYDYGFWGFLRDLLVLTNPIGLLATAVGAGDLPDAVTAYETASWETPFPQLVSNGGRLDFGDRALSDAWWSYRSGSPNLIQGSSSWGASQNDAPRWAARQFWAASNATWRLRRGTVYRPMYFEYMVDHPFFGAPTTLFDLIVVDAAKFRTNPSHSLEATPHEIGHAIHNRYHSGYSHWLTGDSLEYATNHTQCGEHTQKLGWYEGFANFIEDYVNSAGGTSYKNGAVWRPFDGCSLAGLAREGNDQALLNRIYFGPLDRTYRVGDDREEAEFSCPAGFTKVKVRNPLNEWRCQRTRPATCAPGQEYDLLIDELGGWDLCDPVPGLTPPPLGSGTTRTFPCAPGELCLAPIQLGGTTVLLPTDVLLGQGGGSGSSPTVQITIEVDDPDEEEDPTEPTWSPGQDVVEVDPADLIDGDLTGAVQIFPTDCSFWDDPTGTIHVQRQSGRDQCVEDGPAHWTAPVDPGDPETLRADGTERSVIVPTTGGPREWLALAELDDMIEMVAASGSGQHRFQEHWNATIQSFCRSSDLHGRSYFCNPDLSPVFRAEIADLGTLQIGP